ncbi:MAG: anti-sigma factor family protein [Acetobacteraceae bacterium]
MTRPHADALGVLIQADLDGELDAVQAADLALHVAGCEECQRLLEELRALKAALRRELPRYQAPAALREAVARQVGGKTPGGQVDTPQSPRRIRWRWRRLAPLGGGFVAGAAVAAVLAVMLLPSPPPEDRRVASEVATASERAMQPGHLFDIRSTRRFELRQWFQARMGFAPPVRLPAGFALKGGRLDYLHHRPVAVIAYAHTGGTIELYAWPEAHVPTPPEPLNAAGYALSYWREGGIEYWAAGRSKAAVAAFVQAWHRSA